MKRLVTTIFLLTVPHSIAYDDITSLDPNSVHFRQMARVSLKMHGDKPESIVYGNSHYGFFETKEFFKDGGSIHLQFVPPGFRIPIRFFKKSRSRIQFLRSWMPKNRLPSILKNHRLKITRGKLSANYYLVDDYWAPAVGSNDEKRRLGIHFPAIYNRDGDLVWAGLAGANMGWVSHILTKQLEQGQYITQSQDQFIRFDFRGQEKFRVRVPNMHHDFVIHIGSEIISLGTERRFLRHGLLPPVGVELDTMLRVNTISRKTEKILNLLELFWPVRPIPVLDGKGNENVYGFNSIARHSDGGFIVASGRLNTVFLLDEGFKRTLWRLGPKESDDFHSDPRMVAQHHVTQLPNGNLLMLSNGKEVSRVFEVFLDRHQKAGVIVKEFVVGKIENNHGSAFLKNARIIVLYSSGNKDGYGERHLMEFDYAQGLITADARLKLDTECKGYHAEPLDHIGTEEFLGYDPPMLSVLLTYSKRMNS